MAQVNGEELVDLELLVGEERERSPSPVSSAPGRGKLRDLDGIDGVVLFPSSGFSLCFSVWDNVEPLAAVADVPTMLADGIDGAVFFCACWFELCSSVWDNVEPLAAAADVPDRPLWKRFSFSARAVVSCGVGGSRPKRARAMFLRSRRFCSVTSS